MKTEILNNMFVLFNSCGCGLDQAKVVLDENLEDIDTICKYHDDNDYYKTYVVVKTKNGKIYQYEITNSGQEILLDGTNENLYSNFYIKRCKAKNEFHTLDCTLSNFICSKYINLTEDNFIYKTKALLRPEMSENEKYMVIDNFIESILFYVQTKKQIVVRYDVVEQLRRYFDSFIFKYNLDKNVLNKKYEDLINTIYDENYLIAGKKDISKTKEISGDYLFWLYKNGEFEKIKKGKTKGYIKHKNGRFTLKFD